MIAAVDVHYTADTARAACVGFTDWADEAPAFEHVATISGVAPYQPGAFYLRELPAILEVLRERAFDVAVVDGYVWLDENRPGLGAHLHQALAKPVVGVAKTAFRGAPATEVLRGEGKSPLYVSAVGMSAEEAAGAIRRMHGSHRIPTLLKRVDRLCRSG